MNFETFLPYISRLAAAAVAAGAGALAHKVGIGSIDPSISDGLGTFITAAVYGLTHRSIDKRINPGDVARPATVSVVDKSTGATL